MKKSRHHTPFFLLFVAMVFTTAGFCWALEPREILIVANRDLAASMRLSKYYMDKRSIPKENLLSLPLSHKENIRGENYENKIAMPVRKYLREKDPFRFIRCVVFMYGIPLKINRPRSPETRKELKNLKDKKEAVKEKINRDKNSVLEKELKTIKDQITRLARTTESASVDSEMALIREDDYDLQGWTPNPFFLGYKGKHIAGMPRHALMVSRLDGPTEDIVRKMIDDTILIEEKGLEGTAYFDARWPEPEKKKNAGYAFYDQSIHRAARRVKEKAIMPVVIDDKEALFQPGDCPRAALYCGWYSLKKYMDAFQWQRGAVGYHIASGECTTLKKQDSQVWCKKMIEKGVVATLGPVSEPYIQAFPPPEVFFALLMEGRLTLAECYAASVPFWSWKMVLIGDPLYRPFKKEALLP